MSPRGNLSKCEDNFSCYNWGEKELLASKSGGHPTMHATASAPNKGLSNPVSVVPRWGSLFLVQVRDLRGLLRGPGEAAWEIRPGVGS